MYQVLPYIGIIIFGTKASFAESNSMNSIFGEILQQFRCNFINAVFNLKASIGRGFLVYIEKYLHKSDPKALDHIFLEAN